MARPIRILYAEDSVDDFELVLRQLRADGLAVEAVRIDAAGEFRAALIQWSWDAIISDYNLPSFTAADALSAVQATGADLPFIVVTGSIGEDRAVELMRRGAHDFVLKQHLNRLAAAIERAIGDARVRRERAQAVEQLRATNRELATLVAAAPLAIIALDAAGMVHGWNAAAVRLLGWDMEEVVARPMPDVDGDAPPRFSALCAQASAGRTLHALETRVRNREGRLLDVSLSMAPLGSSGGCLGLVEDITERKRLEGMLLQSQKLEAIGLLAGGVAHDFNNILGVIMGYGERLLSRTPADDIRRRPAEEICKAAERASTLTHQLLAFGRKQALSAVVIDLNEVIRQMEGMLHRLIGEDIAVSTELHVDPLPILCDPGQIEVVIMNLVVNARDAMPGGGRLRISTALAGAETDRRHAILVVGDTGMGMDAATQARIFEPFFTTKERGRGTGLGLSTVFGIIRQSGGQITVNSAPGSGSEFRIQLPVSEAAVVVPAQAVAEQLRGHETILLVEDEPGLRDLIDEHLRSNGYAVIASRDAEEAVQLHSRQPGGIQLLLTDVVLPGMSGVVLAGRLLSLDPGLRVVYMSGYTDDAILRRGVSTHGTAMIEKPFRSDALLRLVRRVLDGVEPA